MISKVLVMEEKTKKALSRLQAQCSKREYCTSDVRRKALTLLDGDAVAADEVIEALKAENYLSDLRYATFFARDKSSIQGWGPVKISFQLAGKGIDRQTISQALAEIDSDKAEDRMEAVLRSKYKLLVGDKDVKLKLLKFALSRGYEYDAVKGVVDNIISENKDEE